MIPASLVILNCIEDTKHFLVENGDSLNEWYLVSTLGSVRDYLLTQNIECKELSSFITNDDHLDPRSPSNLDIFNNLLSDLDRICSEFICSMLSISKINIFQPLYNFAGLQEYTSLLRSQKAFEVLFNNYKFETVLLYQSIKTIRYGNNDFLLFLLGHLKSKFNYSIKVKKISKFNFLKSDSQRLFAKFKRNALNLQKTLRHISAKIFPIRFDSSKKTILLFKNLYDLEFLKEELSGKYNLVISDWDTIPNMDNLNYVSAKNTFQEINSFLTKVKVPQKYADDSIIWNFFGKCLVEDFQSNLKEYIQILLVLDILYNKIGVDIVIWGNSPNCYQRALIVEYFFKKNIPIVGATHGGGIGSQYAVEEIVSEYTNRSTHYFSYGFDNQDLLELYPDELINTKIIPVGSYKEYEKKQISKKNTPKEIIDILFPLHISISEFHGSIRRKADQFHFYQRGILSMLDQLVNHSVVIKPMPYANDRNCAVLGTIKKLKHAKVIWGMPFTECLQKYRVNAVVFEFTSTPLYEVIGEDIEIFTILDPNVPFGKKPLKMLQKRVHCFDTLKDLQEALSLYCKGALPKLRNDEFYLKYVYKENTSELILNTLENLLKPQFR